MAWVKQKPIFVVFEGVEGAGKTTQTRLLYEKLKRNKRMVIYTDEPGATLKGFQIRSILLDKDDEELDPIAEFLLFEADRAQHISQVIAPSLKKGFDIVCDRFSPSTFAYQGYGRGLINKYLALMKTVDTLARNGVEPDLYVLLDLEPRKGLWRIKGPRTRFEEEKIAFHTKVRNGFLKQARQNPKKWLVVDASKPINIIQEEIWKATQKILPSISTLAVPLKAGR